MANEQTELDIIIRVKALEEGAKGAPKKYETIGEYKNRLRGALGLPLDSKLNDGNKGIEK